MDTIEQAPGSAGEGWGIQIDRPRSMDAVEQAPGAERPWLALSVLTLVVGAGGMGVSFLFLASANHLNVIAGAAGFVAGSVLAAAGLLSLTIQSRAPGTILL